MGFDFKHTREEKFCQSIKDLIKCSPSLWDLFGEADDMLNSVWNLCLEGKAAIQDFEVATDAWYSCRCRESGFINRVYSGSKGVYATSTDGEGKGTDLKSVPFQAVAYSEREPL